MWIFDFLPSWFSVAFLAVGLLLIIASIFLKIIPIVDRYYLPIRVVGGVVILFAMFFMGAQYNNDQWVARVNELEKKLAAAEVKTAQENTKIVEKVVTRREVIKQKGKDIIQYVDREVVKYDSMCVIPKEFVEAHNRAAENIK